MIQHDCGHGSFFRAPQRNDWVGRAIGVLTLTPYDDWRRTHAIHHATSGNLDRRGMGDITTLTVREYLALPGRRRLALSPLPPSARDVRAGAGLSLPAPAPAAVRVMRAAGGPGSARWPRTAPSRSLAAAALADRHRPLPARARCRSCCWRPPIGVWLFYVQHQFEETFWAEDDDWSLHEAALHGSSHYDLPAVLRWFTANIGVHHVHHLSSRIPFYRLPRRAARPSGAARRSTGSPCCRASAACAWRSGTRTASASSRSAR